MLKKMLDTSISKKQAILCGIAASASWGFSTVMTKGVLENIDPIPLLAFQLIASNCFLWSIIYIRKVKLLSFGDSLKIGLPGLLQPCIAYTLGLIGLSLTNASIDALIWSTESIVIIFLARLLLGEKLSKLINVLSLVILIGVILVSINLEEKNIFASSSIIGNLLILSATSCAALYTIISRRLVFSINSLLLVSLNQMIGLLGVILIFTISQFWISKGINFNTININTWFLIILSGITLHGLPFWLHTMLLENLEASISAFFITLIPVFAIVGAYLFLGERLSLIQWIGTILILGSVLIVLYLQSE